MLELLIQQDDYGLSKLNNLHLKIKIKHGGVTFCIGLMMSNERIDSLY